MSTRFRFAILSICLVAALPVTSLAAWTDSGILISEGVGEDFAGPPIPDGQGGVIVTWFDYAPGNWRIMAQRVDASGVSRWTSGGVTIVDGLSYHEPFGAGILAISDTQGGAYIAWPDGSGGTIIRCQRVSSAGVPLWSSPRDINIIPGREGDIYMTPDGAGGAVIAWQLIGVILVQRISPEGLTLWEHGGNPGEAASIFGNLAGVHSSGIPGMVFVLGQDPLDSALRIQALDSDGYPLWGGYGILDSDYHPGEGIPRAVADGGGGLLVTWSSARDGDCDIYAQRMTLASPVGSWTADGIAVCAADSDQVDPEIVCDGDQRCRVVWWDDRYSGTTRQPWAQSLDFDGTLLWPADGAGPLYPMDPYQSDVISDGAGGVWVTCYRPDSGIRLYGIEASGALRWGGSGVPVHADCTQGYYLGSMPDGEGGAYVSWSERRDDPLMHVYLQHMCASGAWGVPTAWTEVADGALAAADGRGAAWADIDGDRDPDLVLTVGAGSNHLFRNDGGALTEIAAGDLADPAGVGYGAAWGDYDGDGDPDLYLLNHCGPNKLLRNDSGTFTDVTAPPLDDASCAGSAAWIDIDGDLDLDIYLVTGAANRVFLNQGGGLFADASAAPLADTGDGKGQAWADYDRDGDLDLYLVNYNSPNRLLRNDGGGQFTAAGSGPVDYAGDCRSAVWVDYDADGDLDLHVVREQSSFFLRNDGSDVFSWSGVSGFGEYGDCRVAAWGDFDNDADLDVYMTDGAGKNRMFRREGPYLWSELTVPPIDDSGQASDLAVADHDGDGDLDIYLANVFPASRLLRNDSAAAGRHWLQVSLDGAAPNTAGVGARLRLVAGDIVAVRDRVGSTGHLSQDAAPVHFGLADVTLVDSLVVTWPRGNQSILTDIPADGHVVVQEDVEICDVTPSELDFGAVYPGVYVYREFTITNLSHGELTGVVSEACDHFSLESGGGPYSLEYGESHTVIVRFQPSAAGEHACTIETGSVGCSTVLCTGTALDCPPVLYVDSDIVSPGDGTSWADAFVDLRDALAVAATTSCPLQIWVAEGTYRTTDDTDRLASFKMQNDLAIYGGFAGVETSLDERDVAANLTVLTGEIGDLGVDDDNACHVVTADYVDETSVLDGFTVRDGYVPFYPTPSTLPCGGGVYVNHGGPALRNLVVMGNRAQFGGGIYISGDGAVLQDVKLEGNVAETGGGLYLDGGAHDLTNVNMAQNSASTTGGGLYALQSEVVLRNGVFALNTANEGAGTCFVDCDSWLVNCTSFGNAAIGFGGDAVYVDGGAGTRIVNAVFWDEDGEAEILLAGGAAPLVSHSLIFDSGGSASWNSAYGTDGGNNLDAYPQFASVSGSLDLRLAAGSPAIDVGDNATIHLPEIDFAGYVRVANGTVDLGAYEYDSWISGIEEPESLPAVSRLYRSYPNPFNPRTTIAFELSAREQVTLRVFDVAGRLVKTLVDRGYYEQGRHEAVWYGFDGSGRQCASGTYFYRLEAGDYVNTKRMVLLK